MHQHENGKKNLVVDLIYEYNRVKNDNVFFFIDSLTAVIAADAKRMTTTTTKFEKKN